MEHRAYNLRQDGCEVQRILDKVERLAFATENDIRRRFGNAAADSDQEQEEESPKEESHEEESEQDTL